MHTYILHPGRRTDGTGRQKVVFAPQKNLPYFGRESPSLLELAMTMTMTLWLLVSASWPELAHGAGSGARSAAAAVVDRPEAAAAPPALELLRVGERGAVISFHVPRLPGRPPPTHFQLRVAAQDAAAGAPGAPGAPGAALGSGGHGDELRKIAVKAGADCAAIEGCQVATICATCRLHVCAIHALRMHYIYPAYVLPGGSRVAAAEHTVPALPRPGGEAKRRNRW